MKSKRSLIIFNLTVCIIMLLGVISFNFLDYNGIKASAEEHGYNKITETKYDLSDNFEDDKVIVV